MINKNKKKKKNDIDEPDSDHTDEVDNPIYIPLCELNFVFI